MTTTNKQAHQQAMGERIKLRRDELGLDQAWLAQKIGQLSGDPLTIAAIRQWESGKASPSPDKLGAVAEALQTSLNWLLLGIGNHTEALISWSAKK